MHRFPRIALAAAVALTVAAVAQAQDSPAAKATRRRLQQKLSVEFKDTSIKVP